MSVRLDRITTPPKYTTSCGYPWAMVRRNNGTQLAFLTEAKAVEGCITHYRGYIWSAASGGWTKTRRIEPQDVVADWRRLPSQAAYDRRRPARKGTGA